MELDNKKTLRETFGSKAGFILSCIGSAIGVGSIWLFPYRVGQWGGATFLFVYIFFIVIVGFSGVVGEIAFGRSTKSGPIGAFKKAVEIRTGKSFGKYFGAIPVIGALLMAIGYSVVVGWVLRYFFYSIFRIPLFPNVGECFSKVSTGNENLLCHVISLVVTFAIMLGGVSKGIEKANKIMMPVFFSLFLILAVRALFLPNALEGYMYLFKPDWSLLKDLRMWVVALGQAFFTLSLAGSGTIIYGSYLKKSENIISCAKNISIYTLLASVLSALVVIHSVFAFGLQKDISCGPPLMFITMPTVFNNMPLGWIAQIIFFTAVLFAAVTSLINLFEVPVEAVSSQFKLSRPLAIAINLLISLVVGYLIEDGAFLSNWMDFLSIYIVPLGALMAGIMFFWVCGKGCARKEVQIGNSKTLGKWFEPVTRYVFIGVTFVVFVLGILGNI